MLVARASVSLTATLLALCCVGCGTGLPLRAPGTLGFAARPAVPRPPPAPPSACGYLTLRVDYSRHGFNTSAGDTDVAAVIAHLLEREFARLGVVVTDDPARAYWSLMILGAERRDTGEFVFSGMLALRDLEVEGRGGGLASYSGPRARQFPTLFNGLAYGRRHELDEHVREFAREARAAIEPSARALCDFGALEARRERTLERELSELPEPL